MVCGAFAGGSIDLNGRVDDDGEPAGVLATTWRQLSGPGAVVFVDDTKATTSAAFAAAGSYELELTADDGGLSASDLVIITATEPAPGDNPDSGPTDPGAIEGAQIVGGCSLSALAPQPLVGFLVALTLRRQRRLRAKLNR
jgi:hypothetical protein